MMTDSISIANKIKEVKEILGKDGEKCAHLATFACLLIIDDMNNKYKLEEQ